jgi:hypothetical protein
LDLGKPPGKPISSLNAEKNARLRRSWLPCFVGMQRISEIKAVPIIGLSKSTFNVFELASADGYQHASMSDQRALVLESLAPVALSWCAS